jgi:type IV secretory pathway protease TraF
MSTPPQDRDLYLLMQVRELAERQQRMEAELQRLAPLLGKILDLLAAQQQPPALPIAPYAKLYTLPEEEASSSPPGEAPALPPQPGGWRRLFPSRTTTALLAALVIGGTVPWWCVNLTASAPRGLWLRWAVPAVVERGMWVTLPTPEAVKPWQPGWWPLLKPVAAVAGEQVCVQGETLWIRGQSYGRIYEQANGQPLPHFTAACGTIPPGYVFLASHHRASLDSRYFGPVAVLALTAQATPFLTWRH